MAKGNGVQPIIIKRKKVIAGGGHHGGAWKVAYADFVTAMMAFFMLMWLLSATTEKQKTGIADYFSPTITLNRSSSGGDGSFGGESIFSENTLSRSGSGASGENPPWVVAETSANSQGEGSDASEKMLEEVNATLIGGGGESQLMENDLRHIVSRISDEGVVIEVYDLPTSPLFLAGNKPSPVLKRILDKVANTASTVETPIAISVHTRTEPIVRADVDQWAASVDRSLEVSGLLKFAGIENSRIRRLVGRSDTELADPDPLSPRNNRIEITFLLENGWN